MQTNGEAVKKVIRETAAEFSGYQRRHYMARVVPELCQSNVRSAVRALGWKRTTVSQAVAEWEGEICYLDRDAERGRQSAEERQPRLLEDIGQIADRASQTDATFQTTQRYTRLSASEVRRQLIETKGYRVAECGDASPQPEPTGLSSENSQKESAAQKDRPNGCDF